MKAPMMKLGGFTFSVDTAAYQSLDRNTRYRWTAQERTGKEPALQYVGPGAETITLPGVVYPAHAGGLTQLDDMRAMAGEGTPLLLVDGTGTIHGYWCILSVRERQGAFLPGGVSQRMDFTLELQFYGRTR